METYVGAFFCFQCNEEHADVMFCKCGSCLYKTSKQIDDRDENGHLIVETYPIVECRQCGQRHFWD